jgi:hypothetical protein
MVLLLLTDGSIVEIPHCEDVVHKPGCIVCLDYLETPITSFLAEDVLAYTLDSLVARAMKDPEEGDQEIARVARRRSFMCEN